MRILKTLNLIIIGRIGPESLDLTDIRVPETATIVQMGYNQLNPAILANQIRSMWVGDNFAYRTDSESFKNQIHLIIELLFPYTSSLKWYLLVQSMKNSEFKLFSGKIHPPVTYIQSLIAYQPS